MSAKNWQGTTNRSSESKTDDWNMCVLHNPKFIWLCKLRLGTKESSVRIRKDLSAACHTKQGFRQGEHLW